MKANSSKVDTPKILLIILGVLAAIVIGFSSKAIGSSNNLEIHRDSKIRFEKSVDKVYKQSSTHMAKSIVDYFTQK